jgi:hypothetical protein
MPKGGRMNAGSLDAGSLNGPDDVVGDVASLSNGAV